MTISVYRKRTLVLVFVIAFAIGVIANGLLRLNAAVAESEQTEYLAFATTVGNIGETMTQPNAECRNVRARMTILPSIVPPLAPADIASDIEDSIRSTDALCAANNSTGENSVALRRIQKRQYAAAIAAFSDDFRSRFPASFNGLQALLFVGHPYLKEALDKQVS